MTKSNSFDRFRLSFNPLQAAIHIILNSTICILELMQCIELLDRSLVKVSERKCYCFKTHQLSFVRLPFCCISIALVKRTTLLPTTTILVDKLSSFLNLSALVAKMARSAFNAGGKSVRTLIRGLGWSLPGRCGFLSKADNNRLIWGIYTNLAMIGSGALLILSRFDGSRWAFTRAPLDCASSSLKPRATNASRSTLSTFSFCFFFQPLEKEIRFSLVYLRYCELLFEEIDFFLQLFSIFGSLFVSKSSTLAELSSTVACRSDKFFFIDDISAWMSSSLAQTLLEDSLRDFYRSANVGSIATGLSSFVRGVGVSSVNGLTGDAGRWLGALVLVVLCGLPALVLLLKL